MTLITIWGNCQVGPLYNILLKMDYKVKYYINFVYIQDKIDLPEEFYKCDIFITQNTELKDQYSLEEIKKKLKSDVKIISIPYIVFTGYWPGKYITSINKSICKKHPYGLWPYMLRIPQKNTSLEEVERSLNILRNIEEKSDIVGITDYIKNNYRERRLFYTERHPYPEILELMYKQIYSFLNIKVPENTRIYHCFEEIITPIHNMVGEELNLKFKLDGYTVDYPNLTNYDQWFEQQMIDYSGNGTTCDFCYKK